MMTSSQMPIVRVEGTKARMRKFLKDVNNRASKVVRDGNAAYLALPAQELGWLDKVTRDTGVKKLDAREFPAHEKAPCGVLTTRLRYHIGRCKKCAALRPPKPHNGECKTVLKVEGLQDMTLGGLIVLMKSKMDEALALAQEYDTTIKALEEIPTLQGQLGVLQKQIAEHRQALDYFTRHG